MNHLPRTRSFIIRGHPGTPLNSRVHASARAASRHTSLVWPPELATAGLHGLGHQDLNKILLQQGLISHQGVPGRLSSIIFAEAQSLDQRELREAAHAVFAAPEYFGQDTEFNWMVLETTATAEQTIATLTDAAQAYDHPISLIDLR